MRRLVEAEIAPVIDGSETLVSALRVVNAVVATPARHERRYHHFGTNSEWLAHEVFGEVLALFYDHATDLMAEGEGPGQRLRPMTFEDVLIGAADPTGADLDECGVCGHLGPRHGLDDRTSARAGEGGDPNVRPLHVTLPSLPH
jgi:hypothetical protein